MMHVSAAPTQSRLDAMFDEVLTAYSGAWDAADSSSLIPGGAVYDSLVAEEVRDTVVAEEVADTVVVESDADTVSAENEVTDTVGGVDWKHLHAIAETIRGATGTVYGGATGTVNVNVASTTEGEP